MSELSKAATRRRTPKGSARTRALQPGKAIADRDHRSRLQRFQIAPSVRDCAELFDQCRAFLTIVDNESVVFAKSGPRSARHFLEINKSPVGHVCWLQPEIIADSGRDIEPGAFV